MHDLVVRTLCHELVRIGILVGNAEELIQLGVYRAFYFHGKSYLPGSIIKQYMSAHMKSQVQVILLDLIVTMLEGTCT